MYIPYVQQRSLVLRRGPVLWLTMMLMLGLAVLLVVSPLAVSTNVPTLASTQNLGQLSLSFIPNVGQTDGDVHFQVHDRGGVISFKADQVVLALPGATPADVRLQFEGANPDLAVIGGERLPGIVNYFIGNDPARWLTNLPTYASIVYQELYPGVDLRYDGTSGRLKGTYAVAPGADPYSIRWRHAGATDVGLDAATGNLLVATPDAPPELVQLRETIPTCILYDHDRSIWNVYPDLDDRCREQDVDLAASKG